jgi:hypothetical protein
LSSFLEEIELDYSSLSGNPAANVKAKDIVAQWSAFLPKFKFTQHFITNHYITRVSEDKVRRRS